MSLESNTTARKLAKAVGRADWMSLAFELGNSQTLFRDFWSLLTPLGHAPYRMVPGGRTLKISHYDETP